MRLLPVGWRKSSFEVIHISYRIPTGGAEQWASGQVGGFQKDGAIEARLRFPPGIELKAACASETLWCTGKQAAPHFAGKSFV